MKPVGWLWIAIIIAALGFGILSSDWWWWCGSSKWMRPECKRLRGECAPEYMCNNDDKTLNANWCCPRG
jgi:hypothetical protein